MIARPKCWTHSHDVSLKFWNAIPERRIECSVDMPGIDPCTTERCIKGASYLCRHCTMVIRKQAWLDLITPAVYDPNDDTVILTKAVYASESKTVAEGACYVTERDQCVERIVDFDVPPPPTLVRRLDAEEPSRLAGDR